MWLIRHTDLSASGRTFPAHSFMGQILIKCLLRINRHCLSSPGKERWEEGSRQQKEYKQVLRLERAGPWRGLVRTRQGWSAEGARNAGAECKRGSQITRALMLAEELWPLFLRAMWKLGRSVSRVMFSQTCCRGENGNTPAV